MAYTIQFTHHFFLIKKFLQPVSSLLHDAMQIIDEYSFLLFPFLFQFLTEEGLGCGAAGGWWLS